MHNIIKLIVTNSSFTPYHSTPITPLSPTLTHSHSFIVTAAAGGGLCGRYRSISRSGYSGSGCSCSSSRWRWWSISGGSSGCGTSCCYCTSNKWQHCWYKNWTNCIDHKCGCRLCGCGQIAFQFHWCTASYTRGVQWDLNQARHCSRPRPPPPAAPPPHNTHARWRRSAASHASYDGARHDTK